MGRIAITITSNQGRNAELYMNTNKTNPAELTELVDELNTLIKNLDVRFDENASYHDETVIFRIKDQEIFKTTTLDSKNGEFAENLLEALQKLGQGNNKRSKLSR